MMMAIMMIRIHDDVVRMTTLIIFGRTHNILFERSDKPSRSNWRCGNPSRRPV